MEGWTGLVHCSRLHPCVALHCMTLHYIAFDGGGHRPRPGRKCCEADLREYTWNPFFGGGFEKVVRENDAAELPCPEGREFIRYL